MLARRIDEDVVAIDNPGFRVTLEHVQLLPELLRQPGIVRVQEADELAAAVLDAKVPRNALPLVPLAEVPDALIFIGTDHI